MISIKELIAAYNDLIPEDKKITYKEFSGRSRERRLVEARFFIAKYLYENVTFNLEKTGKMINRSHQLVIYALKSIDELPYLQKPYNKFIKNIKTKYHETHYTKKNH